MDGSCAFSGCYVEKNKGSGVRRRRMTFVRYYWYFVGGDERHTKR